MFWITNLTIQDHFNTATKYLATFIYGQIVAGIICWVQWKWPSDYDAKSARIGALVGHITCIAATISAAIYLGGKYAGFLLVTTLIILWLAAFGYGCWHLKIKPSFLTIALLQVGPVAIFFAIIFGYIEAESQLGSTTKDLTIQTVEVIYLVKLTPLAMLSDGVLAQDNDCKCTIYIPRSRISKIDLVSATH